MKKSSKKTLAKRGILVAGRAQNAGGAQIHADKRRIARNLEKQRLKTQIQHETARNRGPFPFLGLVIFQRRWTQIICAYPRPSALKLRLTAAATFLRFRPTN